MSYSSSLCFFLRTCIPSSATVVTALLGHGWTLGKKREEGTSLTVMWSGNEGLRWKEFPPANGARVIEELAEFDRERIAAFVPLHWEDEATNIEIYRSFTEEAVGVNFDRGGHELPGVSPFKDRTWFLRRLVPPLESLADGLKALRWSEFL